MDIELKTTIAARLQKILESFGKRQKDLAAYLGVPDNTISYFVSGKRTPNIEQIVKIAKYFHVSADYLLGLSYAETNDINVQFVCAYTGLDEEAVEHLNDYKDCNHYSFINELICKQTLISQIDFYSNELDRALLFVDYFLNEEDPFLHLPSLEDVDEYDQFEEEPIEKKKLHAALSTIDRNDLLYFRIIEDFKNCLNEFTSGKRKAIEEKRTEIQKAILDFEVRANADNNEA